MVKKILLILASSNKTRRKGFAEKSSSPPLGLIHIASMLKMHGYDTKIIDLGIENYSLKEFENEISNYCPEVVGLSVYTEAYSSSVQISKTIKKVLPASKIVFGGPHVTFLPEEALSNKDVDFVIQNEGESTFVELLEHLNNQNYPIDKIRGLAYKDNFGNVTINDKRPYIDILDALPIVEENMVKKGLYTYSTTIISSRGCPGGCIYCASRAMAGAKYRARSAESLFGEMYYKHKIYGVNYFNIFDDTFTADIQRLTRFCGLVKETEFPIKWRCDSRADVLSEEVIDMICDAGCIAVHVGIESGSQKILDQLRKYINLEKAEKMVKYIHTKNILPMCSFIIGHHCDTFETIDMTVNLGMKFKKEYGAAVAFSTNTPYPGTYLYEHAEELGVKIHTKCWDQYDIVQPIISTEHIGREDLRRIIFEGQMKMLESNKEVNNNAM